MKFLDQVKIYVKAGNGGHGSPSFRREKFIEYGGPDGGDGGKGGTIFLRSERNLNTLIDYRFQQHHKAGRGVNGSGQNRTGHGGENLFLKVPIGTQVFEEDNKTLIYDFKKEGEEFIVANGGKGGLGNTRFKSSTNRAPKKFTKGAIGEEYVIWLQLKTIADVGIVGLPNAGKSSLLASITNATPKIANYKFTTLNPNLGVAVYDDKEITLADIPGLIEGAHAGIGLGNTRFKSSTNRAPKKFTKGAIGEEYVIWLQLKTIADVGIVGLPNAGKSSLLAAITNAMPKIANYKFTTLNPNLGVASYDDKEITLADIPGLVEGAHEGVGLGIQFLKHIERCKTLMHLIDITDEDLENTYKQVRNELGSYSKDLLEKKEIIVLNKTDLLEEEEVKEILKKFSKNKDSEVVTLSTLKKGSVSKIKAKLLSYVS
jgi:small GTP-binding protein